jgi:glycosyltransferase involved in cell wall biosynthesis
MHKKKLIYISPDSFFDTDITVLDILSDEYDITWYAIFFSGIKNSYENTLQLFAKKYDIKLKIFYSNGRRRSLNHCKLVLDILSDIKKLEFNFIFCSNTEDIYWNIFYPFILPRKKTIIGIHDVNYHPDFKSIFTNKVILLSRWILLYWGNFFHLYSQSEYQAFIKKFPSKISFYTLMRPKDFGPSSVQRAMKQKGECNFLFFGNIEYYKGLDILIEVFEDIIQNGYDKIQLTIAGRGKFWSNCKFKIRSTNKYQLHIRFIEDSDVPDLFNQSHFLVLPYRQVTQSGPLMIAYNYNVPVIASNFAGFKDPVTKDESGYLFDINNWDSFKSVILKAIDLDAEEYNNLCANYANKVYNSYSNSSILTKFKSFFSNYLY